MRRAKLLFWGLCVFMCAFCLSACGRNTRDAAVESPQAIEAKIWKGELKIGDYAPRQVLVKFKEGVAPAEAVQIVTEWGYGVIGKPEKAPSVWNRWLAASLPEGVDIRSAMRKAASNPKVEYTQPNLIVRMQ